MAPPWAVGLPKFEDPQNLAEAPHKLAGRQRDDKRLFAFSNEELVNEKTVSGKILRAITTMEWCAENKAEAEFSGKNLATDQKLLLWRIHRQFSAAIPKKVNLKDKNTHT